MQKLIKNLLRLMAVYFFSRNIVLFIDKIATGSLMSRAMTDRFQSSTYEVFLTFFPVVIIVIITLILFVYAEHLSKLIVGKIPADEMLLPDHINIQGLAKLGIFLMGLQIITEVLVGTATGALSLPQIQFFFLYQDYYSIFMTVKQPLLKLILGGILIFSAKPLSSLFKDSVQH